MKLQSSSAILFIWVCLFGTSFTPAETITIRGKVIQTDNQQAIKKAYVYIISGEEETLSLSDGQFSIRTWQKFPIKVVVEHRDYLPASALLKKSEHELVISLKKKQ